MGEIKDTVCERDLFWDHMAGSLISPISFHKCMDTFLFSVSVESSNSVTKRR